MFSADNEMELKYLTLNNKKKLLFYNCISLDKLSIKTSFYLKSNYLEEE